jgi:L-fuconolactonase
MLASNWPVVVLRASYAQAWNDLRSTILSYVPEGPGEDAVLGGTASRVYSLT